MIDCVFVNGTVGSGKSSLAAALGRLAEEQGHAHAVIDTDHLRWAWPAPRTDPFHHELELKNLAAVTANYREAGIDRFILAGVIELRSEITRYREALQSSGLFLCRLEADADVLADRLRTRVARDGTNLGWYLNRAGELAAILRDAALDDLVLDTSGHSSDELARRVAQAVDWL
jgi:chloramphenicol 3-O-phosphotransferase